MAKRKNNAQTTATTGATVGFEAQLWQMADALRSSMDAANWKQMRGHLQLALHAIPSE